MSSLSSVQSQLSLVTSDRDNDGVYGYETGAIGRLTELHAHIYHELCGFNSAFEIFVAKELADFMDHFDPSRDGLWLYKKSGTIVGCIAVDGSDAKTNGGRIRFLIVEPDSQGEGIGRRLMNAALAFCRFKRMSKVYLWTTPELKHARSLYEKFDFALVEEVPHDAWGVSTTHQKFERTDPDLIPSE